MKKIVLRIKSIYDVQALENYLNKMERNGYRVKKVGRLFISFEKRGKRPVQKYAVRRCSTRHISAFLKEYGGVWTKYLIPTKRLLIMTSSNVRPTAPPLESHHYKPFGSNYSLWTSFISAIGCLIFALDYTLIKDALQTKNYLLLLLLVLFPIGLILLLASEYLLKNSSTIKYDSVHSNLYISGKILCIIGGTAFIYKGIEKAIDKILFLKEHPHLIGSSYDLIITAILLIVFIFLCIIEKISRSD